MSTRLILTFDGLATASLGCYGSTWCRTPAIDAIAAEGTVIDRCVASHDTAADAIAEIAAEWIQAAATGMDGHQTFLITDDDDVADAAGEHFDQVVTVPLDDTSSEPAFDMDQTHLATLIAAAADTENSAARSTRSDGRQSKDAVIWVHSRVLTTIWDAPRTPIAESDESFMPSEPSEEDGFGDVDADTIDADKIEALPNEFDDVDPPNLRLAADDHIDTALVWTQTYALQVQLIDLMIEILLSSLSDPDPRVLVASTGGFVLGQNDYVGRFAGPPHSQQLGLAAIISDTPPSRISGLTRLTDIVDIWTKVLLNQTPSPSAADHVETRTDRAKRCLTTPSWFWTRDAEGQDRLFLKPADAHDVNDVARLRIDVIDDLETL